MNPTLEAQLLEQATSGDPAALSRLLQSHQNRLYNVALRMVSNRDDAAEVTQDAMVKIIEHIGSFQGKARVGTWMVRIVMNQCISHLRKRKLRHTTSLDDAPDDQMTALRNQLADPREPDIESGVQTKELLGHLHAAMGQLDESFRAVLVLRDIDELDYDQISDVLEIPVGTVKSRLFRARLALRQAMAKMLPTTLPSNEP